MAHILLINIGGVNMAETVLRDLIKTRAEYATIKRNRISEWKEYTVGLLIIGIIIKILALFA